MKDVQIFYDSNGKPEFVQIAHEEYEKLVRQAKASVELRNALKKISDLASTFSS